jgi:protein-disulfide isomerase
MAKILSLAIIIASLIIGGSIIYATKIYTDYLKEIMPKMGEPSFPPEEDSLPGQPKERVKIEITERDHIKGNKKAQITLVEFSDFQCPFCARFHPTMKKIIEEFGDEVRWVFKHFPLSFHPQAQPAAEASECAGEQGKFWEFAEALFENQQRLGKSLYQEIAENLGLKIEQFQECLSLRKYQEKVKNDYQSGVLAGVEGTPATFINGKLLSGIRPYEDLKALIEEMLEK